jgi:uncharacterized damage-inducible protein DinB
MAQSAPLEGNLALLRQGVALLESLPDAAYARQVGTGSSVGAQYRHVLDHYRCFLDGLAGGLVDYDARGRDPVMETSTTAAAEESRRLGEELARTTDRPLAAPLAVRLAVAAEGDRPAPQPSSVGRELLFLLSHTVHHFAILRLLLEAEGIACDPELGVAPSTRAHRAATA